MENCSRVSQVSLSFVQLPKNEWCSLRTYRIILAFYFLLPYSVSHILLYCIYSQNFAAGFFGVPDFLTDYRQEITIEFWDPSINNTLNPFCANQDREDIGAALGDNALSEFAAIYLQNATQRLQGMIEGIELTATDVFEMQEACAYEVSPF